jgi:hypothetical protein
MNPKEKAKQLVNQFTVLNFKQKNGIIIINVEKSKKSALILVDEILNITPFEGLKYWQEVKIELLKMIN